MPHSTSGSPAFGLEWPKLLAIAAPPVWPAELRFRLAQFGETRYLPDRSALVATVAQARPSLMLCPARDLDGTTFVAAIRRVAQFGFAIPIVVCIMDSTQPPADLLRAFRDGLCDLVMGPEAVATAVRDSLPRLLTRTAAEMIIAVLQRAPTRASTYFAACVATASIGGTPAGVGRALGLSRRALEQRCARAAWPPPARLMEWARLLRALDQAGRSAQAASCAAAAGYHATASLDTVTRSLVGCTFGSLRSLPREQCTQLLQHAFRRQPQDGQWVESGPEWHEAGGVASR